MNMAVDLTIGEAFEDKAQRASEMMRAHGDDAFSKKRDQVIDEFMADGHMVLSIMCPPQLRNPGVMNALRQSWIESPDGYVSRQTDQLRSTRRYFRHQMQRLFYVFDLFQNIMTIHRSAILGANESADHAKQFLKL